MEIAEQYFDEIDTIVYLSDGKPTAGEQFDNWKTITNALAIYHRYRPIAVDSLLFASGKGGGKGKGKGRGGAGGSMELVSVRNSGAYTVTGAKKEE